MEIVPGVHSLPVGTGPFMGFFAPNVYLVMAREGALIDSGYGDEQSVAARVDYLRSVNIRPSYILISHAHPDHLGGAARIKQATGAKVLIHPLEASAAERARLAVDRRVEHGDILALDGTSLEAIHTPGHSPGHICLLWKEEGILFSGDHVLGMGTTAMRPPEGDMAQYIDSLRKLLDYDIRMICPGHGPPIRTPKQKVEELIQHRLEREEQVLAGLRQGRTTIKELVAQIYPELDSRLYEAAQGQVLAHLVKLEREGRVCSQGGEDDARFSIR